MNIFNRKINFVGVASDSLFLPGYGDLVGSNFEYGIKADGSMYSNSILGNKSYNQALYEGAIGTAFSFKIHGLNKLTKKAPTATNLLYDTPNQFANYGLQSKK